MKCFLVILSAMIFLISNTSANAKDSTYMCDNYEITTKPYGLNGCINIETKKTVEEEKEELYLKESLKKHMSEFELNYTVHYSSDLLTVIANEESLMKFIPLMKNQLHYSFETCTKSIEAKFKTKTGCSSLAALTTPLRLKTLTEAWRLLSEYDLAFAKHPDEMFNIKSDYEESIAFIKTFIDIRKYK